MREFRFIAPLAAAALAMAPGCVSSTTQDADVARSEDRDAQPLRRVPPVFPNACLEKDFAKTETVVLEFDVRPNGETDDIQVTEATNDCLVNSAKASVAQWDYAPKMVDGEPAWRRGVVTQMKFMLQKDEEGDA